MIDLASLAGVQFVVACRFDVHEQVVRVGRRSNQLVEFQLGRHLLAILCVLNDEHHHKRDAGRDRAKSRLPRGWEPRDCQRHEECDHCGRDTGGQAGPRCRIADSM